MDQLLPLASLAEAWGPRGGALGARVPKERLSALLPYRNAMSRSQRESALYRAGHLGLDALQKSPKQIQMTRPAK